ncbi:MAG: YqgE/AlgH family protein [Frankiaceae bacterium]|nr:YqgE/AlgH family protein [Frankiaceae bacterium]
MTSPRWWRREPRAGDALVASPELDDPNFRRTVVFVVEHDAGGTLGVVLNRPGRTPVRAVLAGWQDLMSDPSVLHDGGPVRPDGALCLARLHPIAVAAGAIAGIRPLVGGIEAIGLVDLDGDADAVARQVSAARVFAGHAGWGAGQLDAEIAAGAWYVLRAAPDDVFGGDSRSLWRRVLRRQPAPLNWVSTFPRNPEDN